MPEKIRPDLRTVEEEFDPFSPEAVGLSAEDKAVTTVVKELVEVPVRKPSDETFFRVHPSEAFMSDIALLADKEGGEFFLVDRHLRSALRKEIKPFLLYTVQIRTGGILLWPVRLPGEDGKDNRWWSSAHSIARDARHEWVRCVSNKPLGFYEKVRPQAALPDPEWPDVQFRDLIELAFGNQRISSMDHIMVKQRLGRI